MSAATLLRQWGRRGRVDILTVAERRCAWSRLLPLPVRVIAIERFAAVVPPNRGTRGLHISPLADFGHGFACLPGGQWVCVLERGID